MALVLIVVVLSLLVYLYYKNVYVFNKKLDRFVTPPAVPILGHALDFVSSKNVLEVLWDYTQRYGDIVRVKTSPKRQLLLTSNYDLIKFVLTNPKILEKSIDYRNLSRWLGTGLLTGGGAKWKKHRFVIGPTFHYKILEEFVDVFESNAQILVNRLRGEQDKDSVNITPFITLCTLDIICETAMGTSVKAQENTESDYVRSVYDMCSIVIERAFSPHKMFDSIYFFTATYRKEIKALNILHSFNKEVIRRRQETLRNSPSKQPQKKKKAFLDLLLDANVNGQHLTLDEIRQEVDTFMFAGHHTSASAIGFIIHCIAHHPEVQIKVLEEQREIFSEDFQRRSSFADLRSMKYLELVIKETLRLYPSAPFYARELVEDIIYQGEVLPKGLTITMFVYGLHRSDKYFHNPERFDPNRFKTIDGTLPFAYLPFSAGQRNCIGQKFAMAEMKSVVSRIVRSFKLAPSIPRHHLKLSSDTVLISSNGVRIQLKTRS